MADLHAVDGDNEPADDQQSWDDFWDGVQTAQRTEIICGVEVLVPTDLPLNVAARMDDLESSEDEADLHELVGLLFGEGALADWVDAGMTMRQFQTAFAWGVAQASGNPITFREAYEAVTAAAEGKAGAAPNRQARRAAARAAARPRSAASGGRSAPTSAVSTASTRRPSRG